MRADGYALVEMLAALVLFAVAGLVVASAAGTNLRHARTAATRGKLAAIAAHEMARLQVAHTPGTRERALDTGGLQGRVAHTSTPDEDERLTTLTVTVTVPGLSVHLATRALLPW